MGGELHRQLVSMPGNTVEKLCFTIIVRIIVELVMLIYSELYLLLIQIAQQSMISSIMDVL